MTDKTMTRAERIAKARADLAAAYAADPEGVARFNARMSRLASARKREQQRIEHLVLGLPRPVERVMEGKRKGRSKPKMVERPMRLEPGIEEAVRVREAWDHKAYGTPETWERSTRTHDGALIQLHRNGTIDKDQLEWAAQIANVYRSLEADVAVKVASLEARVDQSRGGGRAAEGVLRVRMHLAYGYWRDLLPMPKQMVLDMIVGDAVGFTVAARRYRVHNRRARRELIAAIDRWPLCVAAAFSLVGREEIEAMNHGQAVPPTWLNPSIRLSRNEVEQQHENLIHADTSSAPTMPPIDAAFLNDRGMLREWTDIAEIIRSRINGVA
ncbi:hypothetical protein HHL26_06625 [Sphingobium sp. TB-6]|uniref:hypothetical protein n=1 Tax=Sphingobium sp. TB-6 TaxID=2728850 RepID=UPI00146B2F8D|nr:hypothetical protein [Sphingobium sp. TB-6]